MHVNIIATHIIQKTSINIACVELTLVSCVPSWLFSPTPPAHYHSHPMSPMVPHVCTQEAEQDLRLHKSR